MGKILDALYHGNLLLDSALETHSQEYQKACHTASDLLDALEQKLGDEEKEMLTKVTDALAEENDCYASERFAQGYCLGALMMLEIMEMRDALVPQ